MKEIIHVAYCLDNGYAEPTCVSMASMLANTKSNVHFHVVSNRLNEENKNKLASLQKQFKHGEWSFYKLELNETAFILSRHVTIEAYYRFFLSKILPELERVIYIDGDTVVVGDILELWKENLEGKAVGVVPDIISFYTSLRKSLFNFKHDWYYFNSGVLLLNLKEFSKLYALDELPKIINFLHNRSVENNVPFFEDQDVLNYLVNGEEHAKFLNAKYNLYDIIIDRLPLQHQNKIKDYIDLHNFPVIIHFIGSGFKKPWHLKFNIMPFKHWLLYYKYKTLTPFYDLLDEKRIAEYNRREKITKTEALIPIDVYIRLFWQDIFAVSAKYTKSVIGNRKLVFWGVTNYIKHIMILFGSKGLYPDTVVDGLANNFGKSVFEYIVQSSEILKSKANEYFVVLCMETKNAYDIVINLLKEYGYNKNDFTHVYAEVYERENKPLI